MSKLDDNITSLQKVGSQTAKKLEKLGIYTVNDMLRYYPMRTEDRSSVRKITELQEGETACIKAAVFSDVTVRRIRKNFTIYTMTLCDESGFISAVWYNNKYVVKSLKKGNTYSFCGTVKISYRKKELINPIYEKEENNLTTGRIVPIYKLTAGLSQKALQGLSKQCVELAADEIVDVIPPDVRKENNLCEIKYAIKNIHFPEDIKGYNLARRRLVFEEFFLFNMGMRLLKGRRTTQKGCPYKELGIEEFKKRLPYKFTGAQERVCEEIINDLSFEIPMNRLVQGDVGSGKTAVAAAMLFLSYKNGHQSAMMAPTELLAHQHYESVKALLPDVEICLLTGSTKAKERRLIAEKIKSGEIAIAIGTHALFSEDIEFSDLTLVITDEQHRFGVRQRAALAAKSKIDPHVLVMTATPIPRTLALILYSDLNISIIDELPPGRQEISTYVVGEDMRKRIYNFIGKIVEAGNQVYIVCPMVEESDSVELKSVIEFTENLKTNVFPDIKVEFLHGKMKSSEKDEIMQGFLEGETKILVSTTVIEVGVNVPNATLMVVENAERFGLSQLHQLRGRVGRGKDKSYCVLFSGNDSRETTERLKIMSATNDGFKISEKDLELRGPGEIFGTRQHGLPEMKIGDIARDKDILYIAGNAADKILKSDPELTHDGNRQLKKAVENMFLSEENGRIFN